MEKDSITIRISISAAEALRRMTNRVNEGFTGGRINRSELMSWTLIQFESKYLPECLERLREDHFDPVSYLESMVSQAKTAKANGDVMPNLRKLLSTLTGNRGKGSAARRSIEKAPTTIEKYLSGPDKMIRVKGQPMEASSQETENKCPK